MAKSIKLSIIVPIYNTEKYLVQTIQALTGQTINRDLEIILVNDGSTDNSLNICNHYAAICNNIKVISQVNAGVSEARNAGIRSAAGEYIAFIDSDDGIENNYYEQLLNLIERKKADIAVVNFDTIHPDGYAKTHRKNMYREWKSSEAALGDFFAGYIGNNIFDKIYRTDLVRDVFFPKGYKIGEDMFYVYQVLQKASYVVMDTNIIGYHYYIRDNSAMTGKFSAKYFDTVKLSRIMFDECKNNPMLRGSSEAHLIHESCKVLEYIYKHDAAKQISKETKALRKSLSMYSMHDAYRYLIKKQFLGFLLMRLSPKLYMFAHRMMRIG